MTGNIKGLLDILSNIRTGFESGKNYNSRICVHFAFNTEDEKGYLHYCESEEACLNLYDFGQSIVIEQV